MISLIMLLIIIYPISRRCPLIPKNHMGSKHIQFYYPIHLGMRLDGNGGRISPLPTLQDELNGTPLRNYQIGM